MNSYGFSEYNEDKDRYIQELEDLLNRYAAKEFLEIDLLPYTTESDKEIALENTLRTKAARVLRLYRTFYGTKDSFMLHPLTIMDEDWVAKVTANEETKVTDVDAQIINILNLTYTLAVKEEEQ